MKMNNARVVTVILAAIITIWSGSARAEMSQGARETAISCAYMGGIGLAAGHVFERGALKSGAQACALAGAAAAAYNYLVIPTNAAELPKEADLKPETSTEENE